MEHFAVFGAPIAQSLSPLIHKAFAEQKDIALSYEPIFTPPGQLAEAIEQFRKRGGQGANITAPLKLEAYNLCKVHTPAAVYAKAVNTIYWQGSQLCGDNTDGEGLVRYMVQDLGLNLAQKRILILGAGGAARGIIYPLLTYSLQQLVIVNRTFLKAQSIASQDARLYAYTYEALDASHEAPFDIVINATSSSLQNELPPLAARWVQKTIAIDLAYLKNQATLFLKWAKTHHAGATYDGIGMLVEQAALAFQRWHGVLPMTQPVIDMLRAKN